MKKILFSLFALFFALCFTSCNDQSSDATESSSEELCNIPITSVEDFSLSDGKYEMIMERKWNDDYSNNFQTNSYITNLKTSDSERFFEITSFFLYIKTTYYDTAKYEETKSNYIENGYFLYEFDDELLTIIGTYEEDLGNLSYESLIEGFKIKSILSGEQEGSVKMNKDKTAFSISYHDTEIGDTTITITKQS